MENALNSPSIKSGLLHLLKVVLSYPSRKGNLSPGSIRVSCPDKAEVAINPSENDYSGMRSNYKVSSTQVTGWKANVLFC